LINTQQQLQNFLNAISGDSLLAIDTEFKRINTYYPELCLVQIATNNFVECIDILAIRDLKPLFEKLYNIDSKWVVHSARQDIEALFILSNRIPLSIFDTQIAASLLNFPLQVSYQSLTHELQNIYLEKKHTRFDWTSRPLPKDVLEYALDDVRYLLPNYRILKDKLDLENKTQWLDEETSLLLDQKLYEPNIEQICKKTKGLSKIDSRSQKQAIKLVYWRENTAQKENKPRKWIMSDEKLLDYACGKNNLSVSSKKLFDKFTSHNFKKSTFSKAFHPQKPLSNDEKLKKNELQNLINELALKYNLPPELICSGKSLVKFIRGDSESPLKKGWRSKILKMQQQT
jgi:ribonuclease D